MKLSEYLAEYLVSIGIKTNFTITGGGAMYLNSAFGHAEGMNCIYVHHEQTAAIAAEGYYKMKNEMAMVCCTTGPGGTNTLTGVLGAWLDSIPMLVISGQVKYASTVRSTGYPMRIFGDQEFDITKVASPMTKYAEMVTVPEMIKYHVDKAIWLATNGRPGPVWIDIPQNVQNADIIPDQLIEFSPSEMDNTKSRPVSDLIIEQVVKKIQTAKRPVLYVGAEVRYSGSYNSYVKLCKKLQIPVVTTFDSIDLISDEDPLYAGRAGDVGNRYGNWAVQNSDLIICLGNRLGVRQVSYACDTWAREAYVIMVYEDSLELLKPNVHVELPIRAELNDFIGKLLSTLPNELNDYHEWLNVCHNWKKNYPVYDPLRHSKDDMVVNPYCFIDKLSDYIPKCTPIVASNGSACVVTSSAFRIKEGQRYIINCGCASMGYDLPAAIGVSFTGEYKSVVCLAGDGSIQMNIQDLQTIIHHKLPVKVFVLNNKGYHSIRLTQNNLFKDVTNVGIGPESGDLSFPNMEKIADAYGIPYYRIETNSDIQSVLPHVFSEFGYCMCEIVLDTTQGFEPKPSATKLDDGRLVSPPLEDLTPRIPLKELEELMIIPMVERKDND